MRSSTTPLRFELALTVGVLLSACASPPTTTTRDAEIRGGDASPDVPVDDGGLADTSAADASPPPPFDYDPTGASGSRLRRRYFEAEPLAYVTLDFWDSELEISCRFERTPDGEWRCLPTELDDVYFGDARCTEAVILTGADRCRGVYARQHYTRQIYRRTEAPSTATELFYKNNEGRCARTTIGGETAWVAEPISDSTFQRGTQSTEDRADGLAVIVVDGDDGSRAIVDVVDTARGTSCDFEFEPGRCVPKRRGRATLFTSSSCTTRIGQNRSSDPPGILYTDVTDASRCVTGHEYYEVGPRITPSELFYMSSTGSCTPTTPYSRYTHYELGPPVTETSFPAVDESYEGTAWVNARRHVDSAGQPLGAAHVFWDTRNDVECRPVQFDDGSYRCLPVNAAQLHSEEFSGADCTGESLASFSCGHVGEYFYEPDTTCHGTVIPRVENVYTRGDSYGERTYWFLTYDGSRCIERESEPYRFRYRIGPRAIPSEFPELQLRVE